MNPYYKILIMVIVTIIVFFTIVILLGSTLKGKPSGKPCNGDASCAGYCDGSVCQDFLIGGTPATDPTTCVSGAIKDGVCTCTDTIYCPAGKVCKNGMCTDPDSTVPSKLGSPCTTTCGGGFSCLPAPDCQQGNEPTYTCLNTCQ